MGGRTRGRTPPGGVTGRASARGGVKGAPPSADFSMYSKCCLVGGSAPTANTYTFPWLSVRTVHPSKLGSWPLLVARDAWRTVQDAPPSVEVATISGVGSAWPRLLLRKSAQHT